MAQNDNFKRYLDAGLAFTQLTRERAEALVNDLVKAGEIRRKEAQDQIEELLERSQKNSEYLVGIVRREVAEQLRNMGLQDLAKRADTAKKEQATSRGDSGATQTSAPVAEPPSAARKQGAAKKKPAAKAAATKKTAAAASKDRAATPKPAGTKAGSAARPAKKAAGKKSAAPPT